MDAELLDEANDILETKPRNKKKIILIVALSIGLGLAVLTGALLALYFFYLRNGTVPEVVNTPEPFEDPDPGDMYPYIPAPRAVKTAVPFVVGMASQLVAMEDPVVCYSVFSRRSRIA